MRSRFLVHGLLAFCASGVHAGEITGRVVSEGRPVVGATVSAMPYSNRYATALRETRNEAGPPAIVTATTAADGRYKLVVPPTAPAFNVRISFGGLAPQTIDGVFEGSDSDDLGEVTLGRSESINGRVVDAAGKPVAGARVRVGRDGIPVTTNKDGLFRFDDLPGRTGPAIPAIGGVGGGSTLNVHAAGFEVQEAPARYSGAPVTVKLKASTARFAGSLKDPLGKPAIDAVVRVVGEGATRWIRTDATGRFEVPGVSPKQGRVQAFGKDGSSLDVVIPPGTTASSIFTLARPASIEGRVTQLDTGRAVAGVKVWARASGVAMSARSGVDGRYRLTGLPQASYRVTFDEKRFVPMNRRGVDLEPGEAKTLDVALTPAVTLVGKVSDEKGRPIAGARGTIASGTESRLEMMFRARGADGNVAFVSGVDGTFKAARLAPGANQKLTVTHAEFERRVIPGIDLVAGAAKPLSLDVVLSPGYILAGVVKDKDGQPVTGADVTLNRSVQVSGGRGGDMVSFSTIESVRPQAQTDFEGKFEFRGLMAGDYDVTIAKSGFTRSATTGVKAGDGESPMEVVLNPGASISGRLMQPNGQPVTGYSVGARPAAGSGSASPAMTMGRGNMAQVDPDGAFMLDGLTPGNAYDLSIFGNGEFRGDPKKKAVPAPSSDVEIEVPARGRIVGRVVDAASGTPITDFEASYSPARGGGGMMVIVRGGGDNERATPFSSPDGAFAFEDVPPGNWDVVVRAKTYQSARTGGVAVVSGETKTIEVKASRGLVIRGRVIDAKSGRGIQEATVNAREGGGGGGMMIFDMGGGGGRGGDSVTDADGRFELADLAPGTYQLTSRHSQFSEGSARLVLEDKDGTVDVPMSAGGTIAGVVMSSAGAPLSGAEVSLQGGADGGGIRMNGIDGQGTLTDANGRFRFNHLAAGRYKVSASMRNDASPVVDVPLNAGDVREDVRLSLDSGATVRGSVLGLAEAARGGLMISAQAPDYFSNTRTNPDGTFSFSGVPKGSVTLRATSGDFMMGSTQSAMKEVVVPEGQPEVIADISFEEGLSISGTVMRKGLPVAGARVSAFMSGSGRQGSTRADESGNFRISGLEAGRANVFAFSEGLSGQASQVVELTADASVDLVFPTSRLGGLVVDSASGLPLESSVELQRATPPPQGGMGIRMTAATDSSGRFGFEDLEPIEYRVTARRSGYESVTKTLRPSEEAGASDLRLELKRGNGLAIEARDAQMGFGLRSLFIRVQEGATDVFAGTVSLDGEGKGEIPGIPAGAYTVVAQAGGYAPVRIPNVMAPATVLRLAFTPGGSVEFQTTEEFLASGAKTGQITSMTGAPVIGIPSGPNSFRLSRLTQRLENMAPGAYRLTLDGGIVKDFTIAEGGQAIVKIP